VTSALLFAPKENCRIKNEEDLTPNERQKRFDIGFDLGYFNHLNGIKRR